MSEQQDDARRQAGRAERPDEPDPVALARRHRLDLSRADVLNRLALARAENHREMLRRALEALDAEIASLGQSQPNRAR